MTADFPFDELRQMGFEPAPLKPPADSKPRDWLDRVGTDVDGALAQSGLAGEAMPPSPAVPLASKREGDAALRQALDCLAEIVFGAGLRTATWQRARAALSTLGITKAPEVTDAQR